MKRLLIPVPVFVAIASLSAMATIINIPGDYDTIQEGIDASTNGDTVLVQPGTYVENINFNGHNITLGSLFLITGDNSYVLSTVIDGDSSGSVVTFSGGEDRTAMLVGLTLTHGYSSEGGGIYCQDSSPTISNNIITENTAAGNIGQGGGINCRDSSPLIKDNIIRNNEATEWDFGDGGGILCGGGSPIIRNNLIIDNTATSMLHLSTGGISCWYSYGVVINNTICNNQFRGISLSGDDNTTKNNIIWNNVDQIYMNGQSSVTYCDIMGGWEGEGNIDIDPLFRNPENDDYHLMSTACGDPYDSPCIDAGDPSIFDYLLDCDWGLGYERSDMGAYGGQAIPTDIREEHPPSLPIAYGLFQNYPNPFNAATAISYSLAQSGPVTISVYNLLGQRVATIFEGDQQAGQHTITWDAAGFPSGVYFARLQAGEYSESIKMVLLK